MGELWRVRNARLYLSGQLLSLFGDSTLWLGVAIWMKKLTGSSSQAGLVFFALAAGTLLAPLAGFVVDRVRRRTILIVTNAATGVAVLGLLFASRSSTWIIYLVMAVYGASAAVIGSAQTALLANLVPEDSYAAANSVLTTGREALRLVTPLLGAGVVAWTGTAKPLAVVDAVSFAAVIVTLLLIRVDERAPQPSGQPWRTELVAGARHLARTVVLRQMVVAGAVALFLLGFSETLIFAVTQHGLHRSPTFVGVIDVGQAVGSIIGGLLATRMIRRWGEGVVMAAAFGLISVSHVLWILPSTAAVVGGAGLAGAGLAPAVIAYVTMIQRRTPDRLRGRVLSAADTALGVPQTVSIALGAVLLLAIDYRVLLAVEAVGECAAGLWLLTRPEQRQVQPPTDVPDVDGLPVPGATGIII